MIKAVCFNPHVFHPETMERISQETGGAVAGYLGNPSAVNCIESFPDGSIYFSYIPSGKALPKHTMNCKNDIERFIFVNRFRRMTDNRII